MRITVAPDYHANGRGAGNVIEKTSAYIGLHVINADILNIL